MIGNLFVVLLGKIVPFNGMLDCQFAKGVFVSKAMKCSTTGEDENCAFLSTRNEFVLSAIAINDCSI